MSSSSTPPFTHALLAGALAGTTVDLSLYPIDTLKTRLQSPLGFRPSGGFRGVYAGVGSALVGSAPGAALFFVTYEGCKTQLRNWREGSGGGGGKEHEEGAEKWSGREAIDHMLAASAGEVAACAVRVPTEVVKQRAQAAQQPSSLAALTHILAQRSRIGVPGVWREMYRGWSITVMREVPFTAIQFPLWEGMKKSWLRRKQRRRKEIGGEGREGNDEITLLESGVFGSIAGAVAAGATTPLDVLKTRMMLAREKEAAWAMCARIWREEGGGAFLRGVGPRVMWISAGGAVFLGSYQWALNTMGAAAVA